MLQIQDILVSLDIAERYFCCDLEACKGQCCLDGDAGAPLEKGEADKIKEILPEIWCDLLPAAQREIEENGVSYIDQDGDEVTSLVEGRNCVFAALDKDGKWMCALESAYRNGRTSFYKPISCHLYPIRLKKYPTFTAANYHRWKICHGAEVLGRSRGIRVYQFLEDPLRRRFGDEWYDVLRLTCEEWLKSKDKD